jgi:hypothetical protein
MTYKKVKREARRRMAETGEKYMAALRAVRRDWPNGQPLAGIQSTSRGASPESTSTVVGKTASSMDATDQGDGVASVKARLDRADQARAVRAAALDVLRSHDFDDEAARRWLQRHRPEEAVNAWPRGEPTRPAAGRGLVR